MEERKFVCKYCSKRFPCGKSLGGHIRTHMSDSHQANGERSNNNNNNKAAMFNKLDASGRKRKRDLGSSGGVDDDGNGNMIYGLRENPKKTTRFVHSNNINNAAAAAAAAATTSVQMEKFCKECGKGFPSLKALCGHMACHSEKDKGRFENNNSSGLSEKNQQKLVMDSQSDTETNSVPRRSKRMRFKNLSNNNNNYNPHLPPPPSSSSLPPNGSSSVSEVEQEQEEVARCLMLLSKDSSYYYRGATTRFALVTESSDNNSVVLEAKSPSVDTRVTVNYGTKKNSVYSNADYELVDGKKKKLMILKDEKLKKSSAEIGGYASDNSDSGYFRHGPKKVVDSDDDDSSDDGFFRNEVKSSKVGYLSGFEDHHHDDVESRKMLSSRGRSRNYGKDGGAMRRTDSRNKTENGFNNDGIYEHGGGGKGSWKYDCLTSERDNIIGSDDSAYESDENNTDTDTDTDTYPAPKAHNNNNSRSISGKKKKSSSKGKNKKLLKSKKSKEHECPICNKIFRSGQALGGHKRSHFVGGSEENTLVIRPGAPPPVPCLIDLNLPAPVDE